MKVWQATVLAALLMSARGLVDEAVPSSEIPAAGGVTLWQSFSYAPNWAPWAPTALLDAGDVDRDGWPDLVLSHEDRVITLYGDGRGGFPREAWALYGSAMREDPGGAVQVPAGGVDATAGLLLDLDGDDDLDLLVSGTWRVRNAGERAVLCGFENQCGALIRSFCLDAAAPLVHLWQHAAEADADCDVVLGSSSQWEDGAFSTCLHVYAVSDGGVAVLRGIEIPERGWPCAFGDVLGDAAPELVLLDGADAVLAYSVDEHWELSAAYRFSYLGERVRDAVLTDFDGDVRADLALLTKTGLVAVHERSGELTVLDRHTTGEGPMALAVGSLDGDALQDHLVWMPGTQELVLLLRTAPGGWGEEAGRFALRGDPATIRLVDLNSSGRADLVLCGAHDLRVWMNGGSARGVSTPSVPGGQLLVMGDASEDGDIDVLTGGDRCVELFRNDGTGGLLSATFALPDGTSALGAAIADGEIYLLLGAECQERGGGVEDAPTLLCALSSDGESLRTTPAPETSLPLLRSGDLDGDGHGELVGLLPDGLWVQWDEGPPATYPLGAHASLPVCVDFDGDGRSEVAVVLTGQWAEIVLLEITRAGVHVSEPMLRLAELPMIAAAADIDGDGFGEIMLLAARFAVDTTGDPPTLSPESWALVTVDAVSHIRRLALPDLPPGLLPRAVDGLAIGDFNADGLPDAAISSLGGAGVLLVLDVTAESNQRIWLSEPLGPLAAADLDASGCDELLAIHTGLDPFLWVRWNGGGR